VNEGDNTRTGPPDEYVEAAVHRLLTENPNIAEQGITVVRRDHSLVLCGEVESEQRRDEILRQVSTEFPDLPLLADIGLIRTQAPSEIEQLP
jgi:hypothetical protein